MVENSKGLWINSCISGHSLQNTRRHHKATSVKVTFQSAVVLPSIKTPFKGGIFFDSYTPYKKQRERHYKPKTTLGLSIQKGFDIYLRVYCIEANKSLFSITGQLCTLSESSNQQQSNLFQRHPTISYLRYDLLFPYHGLSSLLQPSVERRQEVIREELRKGREKYSCEQQLQDKAAAAAAGMF